jgi:hypothetical protein
MIVVNQMSDEQIYEEARRRVKIKKDFYNNLISYLVVNAVLVVIWALTGRGYPWFLWPLGIWGVFILSHFLNAFVFSAKSDHGAIAKEVEKIKRGSR